MDILPGSGPLGSGPTGPGSGFSVMPFRILPICLQIICVNKARDHNRKATIIGLTGQAIRIGFENRK